MLRLKMAMKDWKKISSEEWKKDNLNLWLGIGENNNHRVFVGISGKFSRSIIVDKEFKYKSDALQFAKDYMKKH
jgi:phosphotransferase system IIB component